MSTLDELKGAAQTIMDRLSDVCGRLENEIVQINDLMTIAAAAQNGAGEMAAQTQALNLSVRAQQLQYVVQTLEELQGALSVTTNNVTEAKNTAASAREAAERTLSASVAVDE
jgi:hypothetical protein